MTYSPSLGRHSYGTTISFNSIAIAEVIDMDGPTIKQTAAEITNLASPAMFKEKIPGFIDAGQVKVKCIFTTANYNSFLGLVSMRNLAITITYPLTGTQTTHDILAGQGQIGEIGVTVPDDDKITIDLTIEASGPWTFTQGAPPS